MPSGSTRFHGWIFLTCFRTACSIDRTTRQGGERPDSEAGGDMGSRQAAQRGVHPIAAPAAALALGTGRSRQTRARRRCRRHPTPARAQQPQSPHRTPLHVPRPVQRLGSARPTAGAALHPWWQIQRACRRDALPPPWLLAALRCGCRLDRWLWPDWLPGTLSWVKPRDDAGPQLLRTPDIR